MDSITRREFLRQAGVVTVIGLGGGVLVGCGGKSDPCSDLSGLTPEEVTFRTTNAYNNKTLIDARKCDNCNFWVEPKGDSPCGGCTLIKGPISAEGYCNLWVKPVPEGGEAAAAQDSV